MTPFVIAGAARRSSTMARTGERQRASRERAAVAPQIKTLYGPERARSDANHPDPLTLKSTHINFINFNIDIYNYLVHL